MSEPITEHREWLDATYKRLLNDNSHMAGVAREACLRGIAAIAAGRAVQDDGLDVERLADLIEKESRTRPHYGRTPRESAEWIVARLRTASPLNASGDER